MLPAVFIFILVINKHREKTHVVRKVKDMNAEEWKGDKPKMDRVCKELNERKGSECGDSRR